MTAGQTTLHLANGPVSLDITVDSDDCRTVGDVIALYRDQLNIAAGSTPTVNGTPVTPATPVRSGDSVAFTKTSGSKG